MRTLKIYAIYIYIYMILPEQYIVEKSLKVYFIVGGYDPRVDFGQLALLRSILLDLIICQSNQKRYQITDGVLPLFSATLLIIFLTKRRMTGRTAGKYSNPTASIRRSSLLHAMSGAHRADLWLRRVTCSKPAAPPTPPPASSPQQGNQNT